MTANSSFNGFGTTAKNAELAENSIAIQFAAERTECARLRALVGELRIVTMGLLPYANGSSPAAIILQRNAAYVLAKTVEAQ